MDKGRQDIYVAWTNITMTVCFFKDGPMILTLKFGQNLVSNSGDIPDMDKMSP